MIRRATVADIPDRGHNGTTTHITYGVGTATAGDIRGGSSIDRNDIIRLNGFGSHTCTAQTDLFLHRKDRVLI